MSNRLIALLASGCAAAVGCTQPSGPTPVEGTTLLQASRAQSRNAPPAADDNGNCSDPGYRLNQRQNTVETVITVSMKGAASVQSEDAAQPPVRGAIVRYQDEQVFALDYAGQTFVEMTLDAAIQQRLDDRNRFANAVQPDIGPIASPPPPTIERDHAQGNGHGKILGIETRSYIVRDSASGTVMRLSYSNELPMPTDGVRKRLAQLEPWVAADSKQQGETVVDEIAGRTLMRTEVQVGSHWVTVMDTTSVDRIAVSCSTYEPPAGWQQSLSASLMTAHTTFGKLGPVPLQTTANVISGPGPWMNNPEVHAFFWGRTFADPNHRPAVNQLYESLQRLYHPTYTAALGNDYGIAPGKTVDLHIIDDNPPSYAGSGGAGAALGAFVLGQGLSENGPLFWWKGGAAPLYMVFIPEDEVDSSAWSGYHFIAPNLVTGVAPFPLNFIVYEGMPYSLVKVPSAALALPTEGLLQRDNCTAFPGLCSTISSFDAATVTMSHEYVEAATDPIPFWGYSDTGKVPVWTDGEIADICQKAQPWGVKTRIDETVLSTYWSTSANACVPNSLPSITIFEPSDGAAIAWQAGGPRITARAYASDPVDGDGTPTVLNSIQWTLDSSSFPFASGPSVLTPRLSQGSHSLTASFTDTQSRTATATVHFAVAAQAPVPTIMSPAPGASYASDDTILLRGDGFDLQDGSLPDSSLAWSVNGSAVGTGRLVQTKIPTQGTATISLLVTNSAGISATATETIHIGPAAHNPFVVITTPKNDAQFGGAQTISFQATATDWDGSPLPDSAIRWTSDVDGFLGTGASLSAPVSGGTCGIEIENITVTVTNSAGKTATDTIRIQVGQVC